jgi:hypothetical protein
VVTLPPEAFEANAQVDRLRQAALVVRRFAGELRYHPATGLARRPEPPFEEALRTLHEVLGVVRRLADRFDAEEAALADAEPAALEEVRTGHRRVRELAGALAAALRVLEAVLAHPERAPLDAPYGLGAPRRPHPGAQATWVAERAESLARELAYVTVVKASAVGAANG